MRTRHVLLALTLCLLLARIGSYDEPLEWDIGTYVVIARELLEGERLYADVWDVKPPAIFATYAAMQAIVGDGFLPVYLLSVIAAIVTMFGVYHAASVAGRFAGAWAAVFWAAMCFDPGTGGNLPNTEVFINAAVAWAFALWLRADTAGRGRAWRHWGAIGFLFALASLYKQVAVAPALCLALAEITSPSNAAKARRGAFAGVMMAAAAAFFLWFVVILYFILTQRGWLFWRTIVASPQAYGGDQVQNLLDSFTIGKGLSRQLVFALPALVLTLIGALFGFRSVPRRAWMLLGALAIGTHLAIALPGAFHPHYHQLWFVPLAIGAGWGVSGLSEVSHLRARRLATSLAALAAIAIFLPQLSWTTLSGRERAQRKYGDFFLYAHDAVHDADRHLLPGEMFYTWSDEAWAYALIRRRPPAVGLWKSHTIEGPLAEWLTRRTIEDLEHNPPELFIHFGHPPTPAGHPIAAWSLAHYDPLPGESAKHFPMFLYVRRGGALQRRLVQATTTPATTSASPS